MRLPIFIIILLTTLGTSAQPAGYADSIRAFQQRYVKDHGAVDTQDRKLIRFFKVDPKYRVESRVEFIYDAPWFNMETTGKNKKIYRVYAILHFKMNDTAYRLHVYQAESLIKIPEYADHLFIPYTDATSGEESYEVGRYIDLHVSDLESGAYILDFNKAYNPYCAYISNKYNCPIPPKENHLKVAIKAGEMKFLKNH